MAELFAEGKEYFELGDYNTAEQKFDGVLVADPFNKSAMRFLKKIEERKYDLSSRKREATATDLVQDVRDAWTPPGGTLG